MHVTGSASGSGNMDGTVDEMQSCLCVEVVVNVTFNELHKMLEARKVGDVSPSIVPKFVGSIKQRLWKLLELLVGTVSVATASLVALA